MSWEQQKRVILPFLQRAEEIEKVERKVAYYCRLYAVDQGIRIEERAPEADQLLGKVLSHLESDKPYINLDQDGDAEYCEKFALGVFRNAERKDRAGQATRDTAKAYYAASIFIEIVKQFGELTDELEQYRRYAIFRATEIKKSLDRGENVAPPREEPREGPPSEKPPGGEPPRAEPPREEPPREEPQGPEPPRGELPRGMPPRQDKVEKRPEPSHLESEGSSASGTTVMDPGYQPGTKVFYSEDEMTVKAKGVVLSKLEEEGSLFLVELAGQGTVHANLEQLAPDLEEKARVMYSQEPGATMVEATLIQVECADIWPPMYVVATADGEQHACASRCLTLINDAKVPDAAEGTSHNLEAEVPSSDSKKYLNSHPLRDSPIQHHSPDPSDADSAVQEPVGNSAAAPAPGQDAGAPTVPASDVANGVGTAYAAAQHALPPNSAPVQYSTSAPVGPVAPPVASVVHQVAPQPTPPQPAANGAIEPLPGFVPELQAIESAKKYSKFAASSLGFDDVESAVHYLNLALRLLTRPPDQQK
ncbi:unnamed protein product [Ostreobium quekettii]|uniref:Uncharacterized protein n=1 Tax=Ostreobium quekettii TaxID=121088 RepID=A0A8S1J5G9_9CHLO|nr:unnamed protein product [Ostreobium quekettii]|eukprot:evm.model.scf_1301EXC.3 EVM.evm.TU.scf_1301EXC.3   scf_1301EXC:22477-28324(-)